MPSGRRRSTARWVCSIDSGDWSDASWSAVTEAASAGSGTEGTTTSSTVPGVAYCHSAAWVNARPRAIPGLRSATSWKSRAVTARFSEYSCCGPRISALSSVSAARPPVAASGLVTDRPLIGSFITVSVPAATLPLRPPPWRYDTRTRRPSLGTSASGRNSSLSGAEASSPVATRAAPASRIVPAERSAMSGLPIGAQVGEAVHLAPHAIGLALELDLAVGAGRIALGYLNADHQVERVARGGDDRRAYLTVNDWPACPVARPTSSPSVSSA